MTAIKSARRVAPWCVKTKPDFTLVVHGDNCEPYVEFRPKYEPGIGPCIEIYRVNSPSSAEWLITLHVNAFAGLIRALPTATNAALRMAAKAAKKSSN